MDVIVSTPSVTPAAGASPTPLKGVPLGEQLFDPAVHLQYTKPENNERMTMNQLALGGMMAPSAMGCVGPFPFASYEGVKALRQAILQPHVLDHHMMQSSLAGPHAQVRGMAPEATKFVYDFWTNPATLALLAEAAGEELVPIFDYELGHTNIQVPAGWDRREYINTLSVDPFAKSHVSVAPKNGEKTAPVVGYHRDAYPWVCVLMLSDVEGMEGGETEIRRGDGEAIKAIGPNLGSCVLMQGGYINHAALPCNNAFERITMVTSFRPKRPTEDITKLKNVRNCSNNFELYDQYLRSRIDLVQQTLGSYTSMLEQRRKSIEDAYGRRGGLKAPTVDFGELCKLKGLVDSVFANALDQMKDYGTGDDIFTPVTRDSTAPTKSKL